ncbi:Glycosyltransferase [Musa troglodytarum]|uniref:Glycosyltransferase n=1 Tax=Musa troglodytarum TaxID=320322 RepID=A0A9E7LAQ8_9LILI|nr:Glycosyltransferase [Musa troglodytarum]
MERRKKETKEAMDPDLCLAGGDDNFEFAFDSRNFSDCVRSGSRSWRRAYRKTGLATASRGRTMSRGTKLFSNGLRESERRQATLRVNVSEQKELWQIHLYPRKGNEACFKGVKELTVEAGSDAPPCTINHDALAIMFSTGGYASNLFLTARPLDGEVQFVVTDFKN